MTRRKKALQTYLVVGITTKGKTVDSEGRNLKQGYCAACRTDVKPMGVEYGGGTPQRYDGISEWVCPHCGRREGRWTGRVLTGLDTEPRFGGDHATYTDT